jgi:thioredoxin-related protein
MSQEITQTQDTVQQPKDSKKPLLIVGLIFIVFVLIVFITQQKTPIAWIEDYDQGVKLAKENNKPLLLMFYKPGANFYVAAKNKTYIDPDVKKYVEANFIPVSINCSEHPDLAEKFDIGYYPTHYVKHPEHDELFGPRLGMDEPADFIKQIQKLLDEMNKSLE